jgi:threonine dehydratase
MLTAAERPQLVVAASGGNHGLAVGYAARALRIPAEVYVPETAPAVKVAGIRATGAKTILAGASYAEAAEACRERAQTPRALYVHAYDSDCC